VCQPFKFQRLLKKVFYWPPKLQLYGPPYMYNVSVLLLCDLKVTAASAECPYRT
jgi:hypothetical protein